MPAPGPVLWLPFQCDPATECYGHLHAAEPGVVKEDPRPRLVVPGQPEPLALAVAEGPDDLLPLLLDRLVVRSAACRRARRRAR